MLGKMARRAFGPRRSGSVQAYLRPARIVGALSVLVLAGLIASDLADDGFWSRHTLFAGLVASAIVVAVTAAVINEVLERRQRERWSLLAQYALFELVHAARLVWSGLLELAGLGPEGELGAAALEAGSESLRDPRLAAALDEALASPERREQLHRLIVVLLGHGQEVLGRWANVMVNSGAYAEIVDRHVELYSRLYWWGSVLDESEPLDEQLLRPRLSLVSPATQTSARSRTRGYATISWPSPSSPSRWTAGSFELAMRIVPTDWWVAQLPDRPSSD